MIITMNMDLTTPCDSCPFRTDKECHLAPARAEQIANTLKEGGSVPCWETIADYDDQGIPVYDDNEQHCAGALLTMEKSYAKKTLLMRWMKKIGRYDPEKLDKSVPVFTSVYMFVEAMKERFLLDSVADRMKPVGHPTPDPGFTLEIGVLADAVEDLAEGCDRHEGGTLIAHAQRLKKAMDMPRSGSTKADYDNFAVVVRALLAKTAGVAA